MSRGSKHQPRPRIVLYTTRQCGHCRQAKGFLRSKGIPFAEQDVERNQRAWKAFQRAGGRAVPLIQVGERQLNGFDPKRLSQTLRQAGYDA